MNLRRRWYKTVKNTKHPVPCPPMFAFFSSWLGLGLGLGVYSVSIEMTTRGRDDEVFVNGCCFVLSVSISVTSIQGEPAYAEPLFSTYILDVDGVFRIQTLFHHDVNVDVDDFDVDADDVDDDTEADHHSKCCCFLVLGLCHATYSNDWRSNFKPHCVSFNSFF